MLSLRTAWDLAANAFAARLEEARAGSRPLLDLADWDPTRCGLAWDPAEIAALLGHPRLAAYQPGPRGLPEARAAVSAYLRARGAPVDPERVLLTASTSEAYGLLFKILCDPGDEVLAPAPCYPLLEQIADLESVRLVRYPLRYDGEWHLDRGALAEAARPGARAVVVVSPANPTGALLSRDDLEFLEHLCEERDMALIGDEVFADTAPAGAPGVALSTGCLALHLAGLSKTCGLPQLKVAWIAAAGPESLVAPALARLEVVADVSLSVSGPAQLALPGLLARREAFLGPLRRRLAVNRQALGQALRPVPGVDLLAGGGGWSAVLRVGETSDEEALCLELLEGGVAVQPGFFYDFERNGHLVLSLLPEPAVLDQGARRLARRLAAEHIS